jgi:hypothetical protein
MNNSSKGSAPQPLSVSDLDYTNRWDAIFSRDLDEKPIPLPQTISGGIEDYLKQDKEESKT